MEPGDTWGHMEGFLRLSCLALGFTISSYSMSWIQHAPGKGVEWISYISNDSNNINYGALEKGKFTISRDKDKKILCVQMSRLRF